MAPVSPPTSAAIGSAAKIVASVRGQAVVQLSYDGTQPPEHLLAALRREGWRNATPSPPPAAAIDWSRPDLESGRSYSVLPYPATTTALFEGTTEQRDAAVERARQLLIDAGMLHADGGPLQDPVLPTRPAAPSTPAPAAPVTPVVATGAPQPTIEVEVVADENHAGAVRARLSRHGRILDDVADAVFTEVTFRGNRSEVMTPVRRITAEVEVEHWNDVQAQLTNHRVLEITRR